MISKNTKGTEAPAPDATEGEWLVRRDRLAREARLMRQCLDNLEQGVGADPSRFSEPPAEWAARAVANLERWAAGMREILEAEVDADLAVEASAEYCARRGFEQAVAAVRRGGAA